MTAVNSALGDSVEPSGLLTIKRGMAISGISILSGLVLASGLIYSTINSTRIGSDAYLKIEEGKDLVADILPPPLTPYQATLMLNELRTASAEEIPQKVEQLKKLHQDYNDRLAHWLEVVTARGHENSLHYKTLFGGLRDKGDLFWKDLEQGAIPAILSKAPNESEMVARATRDFHDIEGVVNASIEPINSELAGLENGGISDSNNGLLRASLIGGGILMAILGLIVIGQKLVVSAITRLSRAMSELAGGHLESAVPFTGRTDEIGQMANAVEVFKKQALENRANDVANELVIKHMGLALENLSAGNLTYQITQPFSLALDTLRVRFNETIHSLENVINSVKTGTDGIKSGTEEIAHASDDLSRRTESQAANLEETAAAVAEITGKVKQTASGAAHARSVVEKAKLAADQSGEVVSRAIEAMNQIEDGSRQISHIIGVIDEIAFQTNLLALNAGVEAARAGEAGRGFAVVASEVRALAQRSAEAAKEIKGLLSTSQGAVEQGVNLVAETGVSLRSIIDRVSEINAVITDIANNAEQQASGLQEVNTAVDQMDQVTQQNAAMVEQTTAATRTVTQQSADLAVLVSRFSTAAAASLNKIATAAKKAPARTEASAAYRPAPLQSRKPALASSASAQRLDIEWDEF